MRDFLRTTPVGALQFDGTDESAAAIASEFGFTLHAVYRPRPNPKFGPAAVFEYRPYVTAGPLAPLMRYKFSPGEYYEVDSDHLHTITISAGSWIWLDRETHTIGVEWDEYFLEHYTAAPEPAGSPR